MDWTLILEQIFQIVIFPLLGAATAYLVYLINVKINEIKKNTNSELAKKYLTLLNETIVDAVIATNQTYVETLKKEGKFDAEAQKIAFTKTYETVMKLLTEDAKKYLVESVSDLEIYITNKIEAEVNFNK